MITLGNSCAVCDEGGRGLCDREAGGTRWQKNSDGRRACYILQIPQKGKSIGVSRV